MARTPPKIELAFIDDDRMETDVIFAESVWVVCYQGRPVTMRRGPADFNYPGFKYMKSAWPYPGHAHNMAERLNKMFHTTEFTVWQMLPHKQVAEAPPKRPPVVDSWTPTKYSASEIVPERGKKPRPLR